VPTLQVSLLAALAALVVLAVAPGEAVAAEVIRVDGARAVRVDDTLVPSRRATDLGPPGAATGAPLGSAASRSGGPAPSRKAARASRAPLAAVSRRGARAVERALQGARRSGRIGAARHRRWRAAERTARRLRDRLRRARRLQLDYVLGTLERTALRGQLKASRMPALFLGLERNIQDWRRLPFPRAGDRVSFRGSELLFQYFPGRGLQLHPLASFSRANLIHGACTKGGAERCRPQALARLLGELRSLAVWRGRSFVAWEYGFHFGGGSPPWMSGMAQAMGVQALARGATLLGRPDLLVVARRALGAFDAAPPLGVRTVGFGGGVHYLQYSFAPGLQILTPSPRR
jgi:hypothetical protein